MFARSAPALSATMISAALALCPVPFAHADGTAGSAGITSHRLGPPATEGSAFRMTMGPFRTRTPIVDGSVLQSLKPGRSLGGTPGSSAGTKAELAAPEAYGKAKLPYTASRVAVKKAGYAKTKAAVPVTSRPYSATGKLYVEFGSDVFVCTASLIRKSVLVTAAHCVSDFGENTFADAVYWYPSHFMPRRQGWPYGRFVASNVFVPTPYLDGTDTCASDSPGVICNNDIATVVLKKRKINYRNFKGKKKKRRTYAGRVVGTYDYGYNGYSFAKTPEVLGRARAAQITQLGYPVAFDSGNQMQRTDALGVYLKDKKLKTVLLGSPQTGGSSGGPWLVNFGTEPKIEKSDAHLGRKSANNVVVGVTSYGVAKPKKINYQGASYFGRNKEFRGRDYGGWGAGNIGALLQITCTQEPRAC